MLKDQNKGSQSGKRNSQEALSQQKVRFQEDPKVAPYLTVSFGQNIYPVNDQQIKQQQWQHNQSSPNNKFEQQEQNSDRKQHQNDKNSIGYRTPQNQQDRSQKRSSGTSDEGSSRHSKELLFKDKQEFNEDTLRKKMNDQNKEDGNNILKQSHDSVTARREIKGGQNPKIQGYLQQMITIQDTINQNQEVNHGDIQNNNPKTNQNILKEEATEEIRKLPIPESLYGSKTTTNLSCREIAIQKQKQRQLSEERAKEGKQKRILDEISFFYRRLAEEKQKKSSSNSISEQQPILKQTQKNDKPINCNKQIGKGNDAKKKEVLINEGNIKRAKKKEKQVDEEIETIFNEQFNQEPLPHQLYPNGEKENVVLFNEQQQQKPRTPTQELSQQLQNQAENNTYDLPLNYLDHLNKSKKNIIANPVSIGLFQMIRLNPVELNKIENLLKNDLQNPISRLKNIKQIAILTSIEGIKEVNELGDSYEGVIRDIKASGGSVDKYSKLILKDMQLRFMQKIFFAMLGRVQVPYKRHIFQEICIQKEEKGSSLLENSFFKWKERTRTKMLKRQLILVTQQERNIQIISKAFLLLKQNSEQSKFYRPVVRRIKNKQKQNLTRKYFYSLLEYSKQKKLKTSQTYLARLISYSYLKTKSFLILEAHKNRKIFSSPKKQYLSTPINLPAFYAAQLKSLKQNQNSQQKKKEESESDTVQFDEKALEKNFVCQEDYLNSARNLQTVQRQITLDKLDRLKESLLNQEEDSEDQIQEFREKKSFCRQNDENEWENELSQDEDACLKVLRCKQRIFLTVQLHIKERRKEINMDLQNSITFLKKWLKQNKERGQQLSIEQQKEILGSLSSFERTNQIKLIFSHWRKIFLEREMNTNIMQMRVSANAKKILKYFREKIRNSREIIDIKRQIRDEKIKQQIFSNWANIILSQSSMKNKIKYLTLKRSLKQIRCFAAEQKIHKVVRNIHAANLKKKIILSWKSITQQNAPVRSIKDYFIKKRAWKKWIHKKEKVNFLKRFFFNILYSPQEKIEIKYSTTRNFLKQIMEKWHEIVIDNDNSKQQQLNNTTARQHRKVTIKTKVFFAWIKQIKQQKGLNILFQNPAVQRGIFTRIFGPWIDKIKQRELKVQQIRAHKSLKVGYKVFHALKMNFLSNKIVKACFIKKFFLAWKMVGLNQQQILPARFRQIRLLKASYTGLIMNQLKAVRNKTKMEKSTQYFLVHIKKYLSTFIQQWRQYVSKRKSKTLLQKKLKKYSQKTLKRRAFNGFKIALINRKIKIVQNKKAIEFRKLQDKKYFNLSNNDVTRYSPQYQLFLSIIHFWRIYAVRRRNILKVQKRIRAFNQRKMLQNVMNLWVHRYEERVETKYIEKQLQLKVKEQKQETPRNLNQRQSNQTYGSPEFNSDEIIHKYQIDIPKQKRNSPYSSIEGDKQKSILQFYEGQNAKYEKSPKQSVPLIFPQENDLTFSMKNQANEETTKVKQPIQKTVRFELSNEEKTGDFYQKKYSENEAFYKRLISSKPN